jgi:S1-C subfamily serine protease
LAIVSLNYLDKYELEVMKMSDALRSLSDALVELIEAVNPSVVRVLARRRIPATGIVWGPDGLIVTANHVVHSDEAISVGLHGGELCSATLVGRDPTTDIAALRVDANDLVPPCWGQLEDMRVGSFVLALGRPEPGIQATLGIISALDEGWRTRHGGYIDRYIDIDARMFPGFSGGPLVDMSGQVLGLNTSALTRGIGVAIPHATLQRVVEALSTHGRIRRGHLGVGVQTTRLPERVQGEVNQEAGLLLVGVKPGSPAEQNGLIVGDIIVAFDGKSTQTREHLGALLTADRIDKKIPMLIVRGGQLEELAVVIGERP